MISRRAFLLGLGNLVTASFVIRAKAHARESGSPLLLQPKKTEETLYLYEGFDCGDEPWATKYRVSLGPDQYPPPPPPTWREHLRARGYSFQTQSDYGRAHREFSLTADNLDQPLNSLVWEDLWERDESPQARAHRLLVNLGLDCDPTDPGRKAGQIHFTTCGGHPGSSERWVDLKDDLSVSVLQARLIERDLPIKLVIGSL